MTEAEAVHAFETWLSESHEEPVAINSYVLVAELQTTTGERILHKAAATGFEMRHALPPWLERAMLECALDEDSWTNSPGLEEPEA